MEVADVMKVINQPISITLLTLLGGGYLLAILGERRARQAKITEKAVEFVTEMADDINALFARIFAHIRRGSREQVEDRLKERLQKLFEKRLGVRVRSRAYLDGDEFWEDYEWVIWALRDIRDLLGIAHENQPFEAVRNEIRNRAEQIERSWRTQGERSSEFEKQPLRPPPDERSRDIELKPPFDELFVVAKMVELRATWLLARGLRNALTPTRGRCRRSRKTVRI